MLLTERKEELWLAPFVTRNWLKHGMRIAVHDAPTCFGPVSYTITSSANAGHIDATVELLARRAPASFVLRVRHPEGRRIRTVSVNGRPHERFDVANETVAWSWQKGPATIRLVY